MSRLGGPVRLDRLIRRVMQCRLSSLSNKLVSRPGTHRSTLREHIWRFSRLDDASLGTRAVPAGRAIVLPPMPIQVATFRGARCEFAAVRDLS